MRVRGTITTAGLTGAALVLAGVVAAAPSATAAVPVVDSGTYTYVTETVPGGTTTTLGGQSGSAVTITGSTVLAPLWGTLTATLRPAPGGRFTAGEVHDQLWMNSWSDQYVPQDAPSASFPFVFGSCEHVAPTGYLRVDEAAYDTAGTLTTFAAHIRVTCLGSGAVVDSDIRVASSLPAHAVTFFSLPSFSLSPGTAHLVVLNRGTVAEAIGAVTAGDVPTGWSVAVDRGTCPDVLAAKASCAVTVVYALDGSPGAVTVHVATPDAQAPDLVATVPFKPTSGPAVVSTRSAGDGVNVSWASTPSAYYPTVFDLYRSPHGTDTWTLVTTTTGRGYADTAVAPAETFDYRVVSRRSTGAVGVGPVSAAVAGTRGATTVTGDPTVGAVAWSTPAATWSGSQSGAASILASAPDAPGTYPLQTGTSRWSLVQPAPVYGCGRPTGTIVVRELARNAAGQPVRLDATVTGTCQDGSPLAGEIRIGVAGTTFSSVQISRGGSLRNPAWLTLPTAITASLYNAGPGDATLGAPTYAVTGVTVTGGLTTTCSAALPVGGRCEVTVVITPTTTGDGTLAITVPGAGLLGSTTLAYPVVARSDTTAPVVAPAKVPAFVDSFGQTWVPGASYVDGESGGATEDVRARVAKPTATSLTGYLFPKAWQGLNFSPGADANQYWLGWLKTGTEYCISYRARDQVGNTSAWTAEQCRTVIWDDTILTSAFGQTTNGVNSRYSGGTYTRTTTKGEILTGPYINARRIAVVATTCSTCGSVDVYVGSTRVGSVSLHSRTTRYRAQIQVPLRTGAIAGRLHLVVTSAGRPVYIDGIGASLT